MIKMKIYCCNCCEEKECNLVKGNEIYPHRGDLSYLNLYQCPVCKKYVGCHPNSKKPLGVIPTEDMKRARMMIHELIDPLWKTKKIKRDELYCLIAKELGIKEYHTGWTRSIEQCQDVYRASLKLMKALQ